MTLDASNPTQQDNPADTPNTSSEANEGAPDGQSSSNPGPKYNARGQDTRYLPPHEAYESVGDIEADVKGEYKFHRDLPLNELLSPAMSQYVERIHYEPLAVTMRGAKFELGLAEIRYANMRAKYGAPPASHLDRIGTVVLSKFLILTQHHETLDAMRAAVEQGMKADAMANNPFNCSIYGKTDDKPGIFRQDTVGEHGADIWPR